MTDTRLYMTMSHIHVLFLHWIPKTHIFQYAPDD